MQVIRLVVHFGSGEVLASGRQEHAPHVSENLRQSASVAQAVDVAGSGLACDAEGAGTPGVAEADGAADGASTTAGVALGAGESSRSPRLQAPVKAAKSTAVAASVARAFLDSPAERSGASREGMGAIAGA
jgi:hypothetical protein